MKRVVGTLLAGLALVAAPLSAGSASAEEAGGFTATAEATTLMVQDGIEGFLIVSPNYVDHGGPTAGALYQLGGSQEAFASSPYLGYTQGIGGVGAVVMQSFGLPVPEFPALPQYAAAVNPGTPESKVGDPGLPYYLHAQASDTHVAGQAVTGSVGEEPPFASRAVSDIVRDGKKVTASASTQMSSLALGSLTIESVRSESVTTYEEGSGEPPVSVAQLFVAGGKTGGTTFSFGPTGLHVAEGGAPVPSAEGLSRLNQALEADGLKVFFLDGEPRQGGKKAGMLEIVHRAPVPSAGENLFRLRVGGADSSILLGSQASADQPAGAVSAQPTAGPVQSGPSGAIPESADRVASQAPEVPGSAPASVPTSAVNGSQGLTEPASATGQPLVTPAAHDGPRTVPAVLARAVRPVGAGNVSAALTVGSGVALLITLLALAGVIRSRPSS